MNELIKLNPTEQFLQNANMSLTLKEIADEYNKKNSNLMRDFKKMVVSLSDDELNALNFEGVTYVDKKGEKRQTFRFDLKTMLWFMTKFDHSLRLKVINFAFEKLEKDKTLAVTEAVKVAKLPNVYENGRMSVRGAIAVAFEDVKDDIRESDVWDALINAGLAETKAKVTIKRTVPEELDGVVGTGKHNMAVYNPEIVRSAYDRWIENGRPVKSEYDRLKDEFEQISKYYSEKIDEAKTTQP